jgi:hypothetical protein
MKIYGRQLQPHVPNEECVLPRSLWDWLRKYLAHFVSDLIDHLNPPGSAVLGVYEKESRARQFRPVPSAEIY